MDKETTHRILNWFVSHEQKNMDKPFSQELTIGTYVCATNGKKVVLIPETEEIKIENPDGYNPPNINGILPNFTDNFIVNFDFLLKKYTEIPIIERFKTLVCESCEAEGKFKHYGNSYDCKECDQTGKIETTRLEKVKNPQAVFSFNNVHIEPNYINKVLEICNLTNSNFCTIVKLGTTLIWIKISNIYVGLSSKFYMDDNEINEADIISII